jgi:hypothetical protein
MAEETFEKTFSVPAPARLALSNIRGSVKIASGPEGQISVLAIKYTNSGDAQGTEVILTQEEDGSVKVETRFRENGGWLFNRTPCKVDYMVGVPRQCSMKVSGVSNETEIEGVEGEIKVSSVSGSIRLSEIGGALKVNAVSGGVTGERLAGPLVFETVSGGVSLAGSSLPSIEGSTVSGGITAETALGEGPYRFKSVSGGVTLRVPANTACTVELESLSGRIHSNLPQTNYHSTRRHGPGGREVAELNGGGVRVAANSVSGGLRLEVLGGDGKAAGAASDGQAAPGRPADAQPRPSKMEILERVERGEITPEEAAELLSR